MRIRGRLLALAGAVFFMSGAVHAQERFHAAALAGWSFGETTDPLYGGQIGIGLEAGPNLQIIGGVEKLDNVLTGRYALFLANLAGIPGVEIEAEVPALYIGGGVRATLPGRLFSPFVQVQFGATQIDPNVTVTLDGDDVTDEVFGPDELGATPFTFLLGAGLRANMGDNLLFETVFQFMDINTQEEIKLNRLHFAFGVRF